MRTGLLLAAVMVVSACAGGGDRNRALYSNPPSGGAISQPVYVTPRRGPYQGEQVSRAAYSFAAGPISSACIGAGRKAANRRLCGCVQSVANRTLTHSDQRLATTFFSNPHQAQVVRQSDNPRNEAFWKRYKAFAGTAEKTCKGL